MSNYRDTVFNTTGIGSFTHRKSLEMLATIITIIDTLTFWNFLVIGLGILLAGIVRGFVGFGASLIIVMAVSATLGPHSAVAIATLSGLPSLLQLLPIAIQKAEKTFVIPFGVAAMMAAPIGTLILVNTAPSIMKMAISLAVVCMVYVLYKDIKISGHSNITFLFGIGVGAGVIQGSAGIGGPPAVVVALSKPGTTEQQRANVIGAVTALGICGVIPLWYHSLFTLQVIIISVLFLPVYVGATWLGNRFFLKYGRSYFRNFALFILILISVTTFIIAISNYL